MPFGFAENLKDHCKIIFSGRKKNPSSNILLEAVYELNQNEFLSPNLKDRTVSVQSISWCIMELKEHSLIGFLDTTIKWLTLTAEV